MNRSSDEALWLPEVSTNPVGDHLGYLLRRCQVGVFDHFSREVRNFDLRPTEYSILRVVMHNRHIRPSRLGEILGIKLANLSPLIDRLEERKLLVRRRAADDQRAVELSLSPSGRRVAIAVHRAVEVHIEAMRSLLGDPDYETLINLLRRLLAAIEREAES